MPSNNPEHDTTELLMPNLKLTFWPFIGLAASLSISHACVAQASNPTVTSADGTQSPGLLTLGGDTILTLRSSAGGMSPQERVDAIDGRISDLLGIPNIKPADVVLYTPPGKPPVIYALGRHLITVDSATAKAAGDGKSPLQLAEEWAKNLQQVLPRVDWRPPNEPEPVIPVSPPLKITSDLSQIGAKLAPVTLRSMVVFKVAALPTGGLTAEERADLLERRLKFAAQSLGTDPTTGVTVVPVTTTKKAVTRIASSSPTNVANLIRDNITRNLVPTIASSSSAKVATPIPTDLEIVVGKTSIIDVDARQAKLSGWSSPLNLASSWAKNVRVALGMPAVPLAQSVTAQTNIAPTTPSTPTVNSVTTPPATTPTVNPVTAPPATAPTVNPGATPPATTPTVKTGAIPPSPK